MSQNLTQPEEIDRILMFIAGREITADALIPDVVPPTENIRDAGSKTRLRPMSSRFNRNCNLPEEK